MIKVQFNIRSCKPMLYKIREYDDCEVKKAENPRNGVGGDKNLGHSWPILSRFFRAITDNSRVGKQDKMGITYVSITNIPGYFKPFFN